MDHLKNEAKNASNLKFDASEEQRLSFLNKTIEDLTNKAREHNEKLLTASGKLEQNQKLMNEYYLKKHQELQRDQMQNETTRASETVSTLESTAQIQSDRQELD